MTIAVQQDDNGSLRLLAARKHIYSIAQRLVGVHALLTILLAASAPVGLHLPSVQPAIAILAGAWTLFSRLMLSTFVDSRVKQAAKLQEEFDINLFGLPWNDILAGQRLSPELVHEASSAFRGDESSLANWYPDPGDVPFPLSVVLCQRAALVWGRRVHYGYAWFITALTVAWLILGIALALYTGQTVLSYLVSLFFPSLPVFLLGTETARAHFGIAVERLELEKTAMSLWDTGLQDPAQLSLDRCRRLQDRIYLLRSKGIWVPEWWYQRRRNQYQEEMQLAAAEFRSEAKRAIAQHQGSTSAVDS